MKNVAIIGAGIAGLASAALLAKDGYNVTVYEKNDGIGGRAMVWKQDGFTFDMGPSWYQMPDAYERFFAEFGKKPSDYYQLLRLDPQYRLYTGPKHFYDLHADEAQNEALFEELEPGSTAKIREFLTVAKEQYDLANKYVFYTNLKPTDFINPRTAKEVARFRLNESLDSLVSKYVSHPLLKKMLLYTTLFIGAAPRKLPALFALMAYIDLGIGTYYPMGGMGAVMEGIADLAREQGATIRTNSAVERIVVEKGRAVGIIVNGSLIPVDIVVSATDYPYTETSLLDEQWRTHDHGYWKKKTLSPSAIVLYLGLRKKLPSLSHHTLIVPDRWDDHFSALFDNKRLPEEPSFYISCTSKTDPSVAPKGYENLFITVQIPSGFDVSRQELQDYRDLLISQVESSIGHRFRKDIILERIFGPEDFKTVYNAYDGAAIGMATTFSQLLLRPDNRSKKVSNLLYAGQYTKTGAGLPMCLISAHRLLETIHQV